jgi:hypothetical protein
MTRCPEDCNFGLCNNRYPYKCICFERASYGFWAGSDFGGPCDKCKPGYYGDRCMRQCPGGACQTCGGHGLCDDGREGAGTCTCTNSTARGYWTGSSCNRCVDGFYGAQCVRQCDCSPKGTVSCTDGRFGSGACICKTGYEGLRCERCNADLPSCVETYICPGPLGHECNDNGICETFVSAGGATDARCRCNSFFAGADCSIQCPRNCSQRGSCSDGASGTGLCTCSTQFAEPDCATCRHGYWGSNCQSECPGGAARPCNNSGICNKANGACTCTGEYGGAACTVPCPAGANGRVCSGHGTCNTAQLTCLCHQDDLHGYWAGQDCGGCAVTHAGASCTIPCPVYNGQICNGQGRCLPDTGKCECFGQYCSRVCEVTRDPVSQRCQSCPEPGQYGPACSSVCQCDATRSNCSEGVTGDGSCECARGWSGRFCNVSCPGGSTTPCSNHGTCNAPTSTCTCDAGWGTADCSVGCAHPTCNGHGRCDDGTSGTGRCICDVSYVWPSTGCAALCDCSLHGDCFANMTCNCHAGFTGDHCEKCAARLAGPNCNATCVNGRTEGKTCVCDFGWAGTGCTLRCPTGSNGEVCSGHGACLDSGLCECSTLYKGPQCGCLDSVCFAANAFTVCNVSTGSCACGTNRKSTPGSTDCALCVDGYHGRDCDDECACNRRGSCDKDTGACRCYTTGDKGYWSGGNCEQCLAGFMGTKCQQRSVSVTALSALITKFPTSLANSYARLDAQRKLYYAGGSVQNVIFNISTIPPTMESISTVAEQRCSADAGDVGNVWPQPDGTMLYLYQQTASCEGPPRVYRGSDGVFLGNRTLLFDDLMNEHNTVDFSRFVPAPHNLVCVVPRGGSEIWCRRLAGTAAAIPNPLSFSLIRDVLYVPSLPGLAVVGASRSARCQVLLAKPDGIPLDGNQPFDIYKLVADRGLLCQVVDCAYVTQDNILVFGALTGNGGAIGAVNLSTSALMSIEVVAGSGARCNAIAYDSASGIGLSVFLSTMIKFRFAHTLLNGTTTSPVYGLQAYGQQALATPSIRKLDIFSEQQMALAPLKSAKGIEVMRFLLLDVESVEPNVLDRAGGAVVTVRGAGFRNVSTAFCKFDSTLARATYVSSNAITCVTPISYSSATCLTQTVEVTMNNITYTNNGVTVDRPNAVVLTAVTPPRLYIDDLVQPAVRSFATQAAADSVAVTLVGSGFVSSASATCKFIVDPSTTELVVLTATYSSASTYTCAIPRSLAVVTAPGSTLQLALDGQIFSTTTQPFSIVGAAAGIEPFPRFLVAGSDRHVVFDSPPLSVLVVDTRGNRVGAFDPVSRPVRVDRASTAGVVMWLNGTVDYTMVGGNATLAGFYMTNPSVGSATFMVTVGVWTTTVEFRLTSGELAALRIIKQPYNPGDIIQPGALLPQSTDIQCVDPSGNVVAADGVVLVAYVYFIDPQTGSVNVTEQPLPNIIVRTSGVASFSPVSVPMVFGTKYALLFELATSKLINVSTDFFTAGCPAAMFQVTGESKCRACDASRSTCDGTGTRKSKQGSWRASQDALEFYDCPIPKACAGAAEFGGCREGYEGPLCNVCQDNWGKDFTRRCYECPDSGGAFAATFSLIMSFVIALTLYVIATVQNWTAPSSRAGDSAVILQLTVTFLQTSSLMEYFRYDWPQTNERLWSSIGTFADFRFYTVLASNCFFRHLGLHDPDIALVYVAFFGLVLVITVLAWATMRLFPRAMLSSDAAVHRVEALAELNRLRNINADRPHIAARYARLEEHKLVPVFLVSLQIFVFFTIQSSSYYTFAIFQCRDLDYGSQGIFSFMTNDYSVDCKSDYYGTMRIFATVFAFVWTLVLPSAVGAAIAYSRMNFHDSYHRLYTSFLTLGVNQDRWYWMTVVVLRKVILVVALSFVSEPVDMYVFAWVSTLFTLLAHTQQPFEKTHHNQLDMVLSLDVVISANIAMAMRVISDETVVAVLSWVVIFINGLCYLAVVALWGRIWIVGSFEKRARRGAEWDESTMNTDTLEIRRKVDMEEHAKSAPVGDGADRFGSIEDEDDESMHRAFDSFFAGANSSSATSPSSAAMRRRRHVAAPAGSPRATSAKLRGKADERSAKFGVVDISDDENDVSQPNRRRRAEDRIRPQDSVSMADRASASMPERFGDDPVSDLMRDIDRFMQEHDDAMPPRFNGAVASRGVSAVPDRPVPQRPWLLDRKMREAGFGTDSRLVLDDEGNVIDLDELPGLRRRRQRRGSSDAVNDRRTSPNQLRAPDLPMPGQEQSNTLDEVV